MKSGKVESTARSSTLGECVPPSSTASALLAKPADYGADVLLVDVSAVWEHILYCQSDSRRQCMSVLCVYVCVSREIVYIADCESNGR